LRHERRNIVAESVKVIAVRLATLITASCAGSASPLPPETGTEFPETVPTVTL